MAEDPTPDPTTEPTVAKPATAEPAPAVKPATAEPAPAVPATPAEASATPVEVSATPVDTAVITPAPATAIGEPVSGLPPVSVVQPDVGYTTAGVPTLDGVREKIETRYGTALGATELAEDTPEGRAAAEQFEARQKAAEDKLAQIRASMRDPS